jgi:hypothetical protein
VDGAVDSVGDQVMDDAVVDGVVDGFHVEDGVVDHEVDVAGGKLLKQFLKTICNKLKRQNIFHKITQSGGKLKRQKIFQMFTK